jgi:hypothetical protein
MNKAHQAEALMPLVRLASEQAAALPPAQRADIYEGIYLATAAHNRPLSEQARLACLALREAETHQLTFANILNSQP